MRVVCLKSKIKRIDTLSIWSFDHYELQWFTWNRHKPLNRYHIVSVPAMSQKDNASENGIYPGWPHTYSEQSLPCAYLLVMQANHIIINDFWSQFSNVIFISHTMLTFIMFKNGETVHALTLLSWSLLFPVNNMSLDHTHRLPWYQWLTIEHMNLYLKLPVIVYVCLGK